MDDREPRDFHCGWCGRCWRTTDYITVICKRGTKRIKSMCPSCGETARVEEITREGMNWCPTVLTKK